MRPSKSLCSRQLVITILLQISLALSVRFYYIIKGAFVRANVPWPITSKQLLNDNEVQWCLEDIKNKKLCYLSLREMLKYPRVGDLCLAIAGAFPMGLIGTAMFHIHPAFIGIISYPFCYAGIVYHSLAWDLKITAEFAAEKIRNKF